MWSHDPAHNSILTKKNPHFKSQNEKWLKKSKEFKFYKIMAWELYLKVKMITL